MRVIQNLPVYFILLMKRFGERGCEGMKTLKPIAFTDFDLSPGSNKLKRILFMFRPINTYLRSSPTTQAQVYKKLRKNYWFIYGIMCVCVCVGYCGLYLNNKPHTKILCTYLMFCEGVTESGQEKY